MVKIWLHHTASEEYFNSNKREPYLFSVGTAFLAPGRANGASRSVAPVALKILDPVMSDVKGPRSLSQILDLIVLIPNDHGVARIDDRYVESAVVFTLK